MTVWIAGGGNLSRSRRERRGLKILYPYIEAKNVRQFRTRALIPLVVLGFLTILYFYNLSGMAGGRSFLPDLTTSTPTPAPFDYVAAADTGDFAAPAKDRLTFPTLPPEVTYTPTATPTATETFTLTPTATYTPTATLTCERCTRSMPIELRIGWFYPPLGGSHCPSGISDCTQLPLTTGKDWYTYQLQVAACPEEYPLGAVVEIAGLGAYECQHRLDYARCDFTTGVCDVLVLASAAIVEDWRQVYPGILWLP